MAAGFIADTASLPLVVSNLVNIVSADYFHLASANMPPSWCRSTGQPSPAHCWCCYVFFRRDIPPTTYDLEQLPEPRSAIRDPLTGQRLWLGSVGSCCLLGLLCTGATGYPNQCDCRRVRIALLYAHRCPRPRHFNTAGAREAPWQVVIISLGMYLVVYGLKNAGLTHHLTLALNQLGESGLWGATLGTGCSPRCLSSIMNNMPTVLIGALSIHATEASWRVHQAMIYANIIGCDLGPKITPIGSLATLLWLHVLAKKGHHVSVGVTTSRPGWC
jgi:arsenical pump membrane protein